MAISKKMADEALGFPLSGKHFDLEFGIDHVYEVLAIKPISDYYAIQINQQEDYIFSFNQFNQLVAKFGIEQMIGTKFHVERDTFKDKEGKSKQINRIVIHD